ncbi:MULTISPECIES: VOC family protein [Oceanobacillus]|uniref:Methylmalonyl-CoA epimerase n=1 Tax=Oceanobacillus kimchii TaxID=746691 RepID=A0ABQ5TI16_9BACI|nr:MULTISPECIES: VOC family protein [Oceanobacillus]MBT2598389.1 VOC family protein [Oceanobacillus sp. ISL-74]MBT2651307.1 VOC family protein [Oceanobacillus sp. ISL-73]MCT1575966.1 VOC family protein [Oceanobacillus kimchii]MCT2135603.1 VOC family protein [Oceanobacillus kimchii]OEH55703.1 lactoylglutathione lyase [Oceanobacillus sp. E9]
MQIGHIGIAVYQLQPAIYKFTQELGFRVVSEQIISQEGIRIAKLMNGDVCIELMEPMDDHSSISNFLSQRGEGIHHLALQVENYLTYILSVSKSSVQMIKPTIRLGADQRRVTFLHPRSLHGVLVEICDL